MLSCRTVAPFLFGSFSPRMQPGDTPSTLPPYHRYRPFGPRHSPFSPEGSPGFLKPSGPRFGQPATRCNGRGSTPSQNRTGDSPPIPSSGNGRAGSPAGQPLPTDLSSSSPDYIPFSCSTPDPSNSGWTPKWRNRFQRSPRDRFYSPGRGPQYHGAMMTGAWRHGMPQNRKKNEVTKSDCNPGHSSDIHDYISPRFFEDPWQPLMKTEEENKK